MKPNTLFHKKYILTGLLVLLLPLSALAASAKVAILPFQMNADKDYTFLQKGIQDMLSSRLAQPQSVDIIDPQAVAQTLDGIKGFSGDNLALMAGAKLKADYVLHGSITLLGESVSIDAKMLDVTGERQPFSFFKQTQGMGEVIPQINLLATEINRTIFNRGPAPAPATPSGAAGQPQPSQPGEMRAHPEKLLQEGGVVAETQSPLEGSEEAGATSSTLNPGFVQPAGSAAEGPAFWKGRNFSFVINGIAVGDVNQDGLQETVIVTPDEIHIVQFNQGRMQQLKKIATGRFVNNIAVDIADINGNGTPEIFVTSLTSGRNQLSSSVLEFKNNEVLPIVSGARWYFRVYRHAARGAILLAQGQTIGSPPGSQEIVELEWKGSDYLPAARILPPRTLNLLGVALGDAMNDKNEVAVGLNQEDYLRLVELNGKEVWTSSDYFGGTNVYIETRVSDKGVPADKVYLPTRVLVADLEGDGKNEVITIRNDEMAQRKLASQRFFSKGQIMALHWNGLGLTEAWHTRQVSGRIQDIAIADFDNDGSDELLCGIVSKEGAIIMTEAKSTLIAYDIKR